MTAPQITDIGHTLLYAHPDNNYALKLFTSKGKLRLSVKFLSSTLNHSVIFASGKTEIMTAQQIGIVQILLEQQLCTKAIHIRTKACTKFAA